MTVFLLFVPIAAFIWAKLEVEIEGPDGWAKSLPTWRLEEHVLLDVFMGGRPLTGYHLWAFTFVFLVYHLPFLWLRTWNWHAEIFIQGCLLLFWVLEDFFWFILNPHFGWKRYRQQKIWWHPHWFLGIPRDHWAMLIVSLLFILWSWGKV